MVELRTVHCIYGLCGPKPQDKFIAAGFLEDNPCCKDPTLRGVSFNRPREELINYEKEKFNFTEN